MTAIVLLTASALPTARRITAALPDAELWGLAGRADTPNPFTDTVATLQMLFREGRPIVGLCAAGILVRALAPLLDDKRAEPAVIAVAEDGSAVVPLVGGHAGGANRLACEIAAALGVAPAITTGSEVRLGVALDAPPPGWTVAGDIKLLAAHLLAGGAVDLRVEAGDAGWLSSLKVGDGPILLVTDRCVGESPTSPVLSAPEGGEGRVGNDSTAPSPPSGAERVGVRWGNDVVALHPPTLAIGVGGERGVAVEELRELVDATLADARLAPQSVAALGTLDLKADEPAVLALPWPLRLFDAAALEAETPRLANPSEAVFAAVGCHGVAEAAALALAGPGAELVVPKRRSARATCAVARAAHGLPRPLAGRPRGHLAVVGIGPGRADWRTPAATAALREAELAVGYAGYLAQVADMIGPSAAYSLGEERDRAIAALDAAGEGKRVALVCSGDAGIYAMAALVHELLDDPRPAWRTAAVEVIPGVSAAQAAAARIGAPLGHDFCCISLSDLLTPSATIERRLRAAAAGDFVVALYNPASQRRRQPLDDALAILRAARPAATPVVVARNVGRPDEAIAVTTLAALDAATVDMLTLLIVGSSATRAPTPCRVYTPRGYRP